MSASLRRLVPRALAVVVSALLLAGALAPGGDDAAAATKKKPRARRAAAAPRTPAKVEIAILSTTDLHGHLVPWDYAAGLPDPDLGLSKVATLVHDVRREMGERTILVDAGDCIQGTPLAYLHSTGGDAGRPDPQMACMNAMGYDAFAIGNHEYNFGLDVLRRAQSDAKFPWLSANTLKAGAPGEAAYQSYVVKVIDGVRVGILGLTTPGVPNWDDPPNWAGLDFEDPFVTAGRMVPIMRARERCDAVIVVCHMGLEEDDAGRAKPGQMPNENRVLAIARGVPGIDAIVMGHTHVKVESKTVNGVLLTQAGRWGEALARVDLAFERKSGGGYRLADKKSRLLLVDESVQSDPAIEAIARPYHDATEALLSKVIGEATVALDGSDARLRDNPLHELIHRAQLEATGADVSLSAMFAPRVRVPAGPITVRDAFAIYPYENTLAVLELKGEDLKAALEHSSKYYNPYDFGKTERPAVNPDVAGYNFDTAEGVTYALDLARPEGERVRDLRWRGAPLDPDRTLRVVVNNYRVNGGGGYTMLTRGRRVPGPPIAARQAVVDHVTKIGRVTGATDGNWRLWPEWIQSPAREPLERLVRRGVVPADSAAVFRLDAPLTHRRFADWVRRVDAPDMLGKDEQKKRRKDDRIDPATAIPFARAVEWGAMARELPVAERARALDPADPFALAAALPDGAGRDRPLTVGQGAAVLADLLFPRITFLEISDFHGAFLPGATERSTGKAFGGAAVIAAHLARERAKNPAGTILLDGGDWMQGTPMSNLRFGRPVIELMNRLGVDAAAIGNHEFDWSADTLYARLAEARFTALGANWMDRRTNRRAAGVAPWTIETRRGLDLGIIGLCTESTPQTTLPQHVRNYSFPDAGTAAAGLRDSVLAAGAEGFVLVGHTPGRQDSTGKVTGELAEIARKVTGELAVFGGHSHNRLLGMVDETPAFIPGAHGQYIARLDVAFDRRTNRPIDDETRTRMIPTYADEVRPDPAIAAFVAEANAEIEPITSRVLGTATAAMGRSRARDSALGNWIADAMRAAAGTDIAHVLMTLKKAYAGRGVELVEAGGGWRFQSAADLAHHFAETRAVPRRLPKAAMETLAVIAYHQPVTRAEIEEIRGVSTSPGTLDVLMETSWIRPRGRRRAPGRPLTYGTTELFLAHFSLDTIKDLPGLADLKAAGLLDSNLPPGFTVPEPTDVAALMPDELPLTDDGDEAEAEAEQEDLPLQDEDEAAKPDAEPDAGA